MGTGEGHFEVAGPAGPAPFSMHLPWSVCYPVTLLLRRLRGRDRPDRQRARRLSQSAYFVHQKESTAPLLDRFMPGMELCGKAVMDLGCGLGGRSITFLERGATSVLCVDINEQELTSGRQIAREDFPACASALEFCTPAALAGRSSLVDLIVMIDVFEHLEDPMDVIAQCARWLKPGGALWIGSVGWYNHMASHCCGEVPIPWCQVFFSEKAIINTIRRLKHRKEYVPTVWDSLYGLDRWDHVTSLRQRPDEALNMWSLKKVRACLRSAPGFSETKMRTYGIADSRPVARRLYSAAAHIPIAEELFHAFYVVYMRRTERQLEDDTALLH